jgi:hypothetical protein
MGKWGFPETIFKNIGYIKYLFFNLYMEFSFSPFSPFPHFLKNNNNNNNNYRA